MVDRILHWVRRGLIYRKLSLPWCIHLRKSLIPNRGYSLPYSCQLVDARSTVGSRNRSQQGLNTASTRSQMPQPDFTHPAAQVVALYLLDMTTPSGAIKKHVAPLIAAKLATLRARGRSNPASSLESAEFRHLAAVEAWSGGDLDLAGKELADDLVRPILQHFGFVERRNSGSPDTPPAAALTPRGAKLLTLALIEAKIPFVAVATNGRG
jgi:hypothetical protein